MTQTSSFLHPFPSRNTDHTSWALDPPRTLPSVPIITLHMFALIQLMHQSILEDQKEYKSWKDYYLEKKKETGGYIYIRDYVIVTRLGHFFERICQLMT
jgi:hypothetical protein